MRDCFDILITKYYTALNGNITYNSASVPIYDRVPNNATFPYIRFSSYTGVDDSNKSNYLQEVTVTIQVVSAFDVDTGGKGQSDNIADQVIDIIRERPLQLLDLSPNFKLLSVSLDDTSTFDELTATHLIVYRNIRFRHKVEQLTNLNNVLPLCATPAPTLLSATAVSQTQINLSWTDNSGGAATVSIERSSTYESGFAEIATTSAGVTTYNNTGLTAEVVYFYRVRALDGCYSTYSNIAFDCTQSNGVCADATVENTNGSYKDTVVSGDTLVIPDITLIQPNGVGESKVAAINLSCTQIGSLADADLVSQLTEGQVTAIIAGRRELVGNNPNAFDIQTGMIATTSYATGDWKKQYDAGYLTVPAPTSIQRVYMLDTSNSLLLHSTTPTPWGHLFRFCSYNGNYYDHTDGFYKDKTGSNLGTQTRNFCFNDGLGSVAIFDIYTSRCWQTNFLSNGDVLTFATAVTNAEALTIAGLTWRIPTVREIMTIIGFTRSNTSGFVPDLPVGQDSGKIFDTTPTTRLVWTANVNQLSTTYNYTLSNVISANNLISYSLRTISTSRSSIATANFTNANLTI